MDSDDLQWSEDLAVPPEFEWPNIVVYLMAKCGWSTKQLQQYQDTGGSALKESDHTDKVKVHKICTTDHECGSSMWSTNKSIRKALHCLAKCIKHNREGRVGCQLSLPTISIQSFLIFFFTVGKQWKVMFFIHGYFTRFCYFIELELQLVAQQWCFVIL